LDGRRVYILAVTVLFVLASMIVGYLSPGLGSRSLYEGVVAGSLEPYGHPDVFCPPCAIFI